MSDKKVTMTNPDAKSELQRMKTSLQRARQEKFTLSAETLVGIVVVGGILQLVLVRAREAIRARFGWSDRTMAFVQIGAAVAIAGGCYMYSQKPGAKAYRSELIIGGVLVATPLLADAATMLIPALGGSQAALPPAASETPAGESSGAYAGWVEQRLVSQRRDTAGLVDLDSMRSDTHGLTNVNMGQRPPQRRVA
ncbi:MAG: hypothetical protein KIH64_004360 [Mycobacterium sp.]|nr:hypothetical protein [Mycobacterium sp.]